jgi:hypothetical protein
MIPLSLMSCFYLSSLFVSWDFIFVFECSIAHSLFVLLGFILRYCVSSCFIAGPRQLLNVCYFKLIFIVLFFLVCFFFLSYLHCCWSFISKAGPCQLLSTKLQIINLCLILFFNLHIS